MPNNEATEAVETYSLHVPIIRTCYEMRNLMPDAHRSVRDVYNDEIITVGKEDLAYIYGAVCDGQTFGDYCITRRVIEDFITQLKSTEVVQP